MVEVQPATDGLERVVDQRGQHQRRRDRDAARASARDDRPHAPGADEPQREGRAPAPEIIGAVPRRARRVDVGGVDRDHRPHERQRGDHRGHGHHRAGGAAQPPGELAEAEQRHRGVADQRRRERDHERGRDGSAHAGQHQ
jgi:hypothetical protein